MTPAGTASPHRPPPERGQHTAEVLAEFGVGAEEPASLRARGAV